MMYSAYMKSQLQIVCGEIKYKLLRHLIHLLFIMQVQVEIVQRVNMQTDNIAMPTETRKTAPHDCIRQMIASYNTKMG